jgi:hypothetical protein
LAALRFGSMASAHSTVRKLAYISLHTDGEAVAVKLLQIKRHTAAQRVEERQLLADQPVLARNLRGRKLTSLSFIFGDSSWAALHTSSLSTFCKVTEQHHFS